MCREWADKEKVDLSLDFITSQGDKLALTATAEAQARSGHDMLQMSDWYPAAQADNLEPVDELVTSLIKEHGKVLLGSEYIGRQKGRWVAVPTGVQTTGQIPCARIDYFKEFVGLDPTRMYPAGAPPDQALADAWTWDGFLAAAEKCDKAGHAFGMPLSTWSDSVNWVSAVFAGHGAQLVDEEGNITVKSDAVKEVLAWFQKIVPLLPASVFRLGQCGEQQMAGLGPGRADHEPAGRLGGGGARRAQGRRRAVDLSFAQRPEGPLRPVQFRLLGDLELLCPTRPAAKSLLSFLSTRSSVEKLVAGSRGVDIPPYEKLRDFKTWEEEQPPMGTLYNYPPRGDVTAFLAGYPAPVEHWLADVRPGDDL